MDKKPARIVCAAIKHSKTGEVILGARHFDQRMIDAIKQGVIDGRWDIFAWKDAEQGFINSFGVFVSRKTAYIVAVANRQIIYPSEYDATELFSENLY